MNHAKLEELRKTIDNRDLLQAEKWIRECGRASIEGWLSLPESVKADAMAVILLLAKTRQPTGYPKVTRLQQLRLEKHWSLAWARKQILANGWSGMAPAVLNAIEVNGRKRSDLSMEHVHALESAFGEHFEALMAVVPGRRIPAGKLNSMETERG
jgi:hypothetical protein